MNAPLLQVEMTCVILYSNSWYHPWSKLCVKSIQLRDVKRQLSGEDTTDTQSNDDRQSNDGAARKKTTKKTTKKRETKV